MGKEKYTDKLKKIFNNEEEEDNNNAPTNEQVQVIIDGDKVIVPSHIAINIKSNKSNNN